MGRWGDGKPLRPRGFPDSTASGATRSPEVFPKGRGRWGDKEKY
ncbi:MAG: hypothetical protein WBA39_19335 [Rivularia sp. (in: cyanobacteria)]